MFEELFESKKLMAGRTLGDVSQINFVYDDESRFCNDSMCCLVLWQNLQNAKHQTPQKQITKAKIEISKKYDLKFLQGVLNSSAIRFFVRELLHDGIHFYPDHQKQLPIPKISEENEALAHEIINLVDEILRLKSQGKDSHELETQIDALTYKLYDLNADEIALIENATNLKK